MADAQGTFPIVSAFRALLRCMRVFQGIGVWHCLVREERPRSRQHRSADEEMPDPCALRGTTLQIAMPQKKAPPTVVGGARVDDVLDCIVRRDARRWGRETSLEAPFRREGRVCRVSEPGGGEKPFRGRCASVGDLWLASAGAGLPIAGDDRRQARAHAKAWRAGVRSCHRPNCCGVEWPRGVDTPRRNSADARSAPSPRFRRARTRAVSGRTRNMERIEPPRRSAVVMSFSRRIAASGPPGIRPRRLIAGPGRSQESPP